MFSGFKKCMIANAMTFKINIVITFKLLTPEGFYLNFNLFCMCVCFSEINTITVEILSENFVPRQPGESNYNK